MGTPRTHTWVITATRNDKRPPVHVEIEATSARVALMLWVGQYLEHSRYDDVSCILITKKGMEWRSEGIATRATPKSRTSGTTIRSI